MAATKKARASKKPLPARFKKTAKKKTVARKKKSPVKKTVKKKAKKVALTSRRKKAQILVDGLLDWVAYAGTIEGRRPNKKVVFSMTFNRKSGSLRCGYESILDRVEAWLEKEKVS